MGQEEEKKEEETEEEEEEKLAHTGRDQPKVVQEVLAYLKRYMMKKQILSKMV